MEHYILNGAELETWLLNVDNMTEDQIIATAPDEVLAFLGELQAQGDQEINFPGLGAMIGLAGKALGAALPKIGKKVVPAVKKIVSRVSPKLVSKARNFLFKKKPAVATIPARPAVQKPQYMQIRPTNVAASVRPTVVSSPIVRGPYRTSEGSLPGTADKPLWKNPIVLAGGALLAYQLIKKK